MGNVSPAGRETNRRREVAERLAGSAGHEGEDQVRLQLAIPARDAIRMGGIQSHSCCQAGSDASAGADSAVQG